MRHPVGTIVVAAISALVAMGVTRAEEPASRNEPKIPSKLEYTAQQNQQIADDIGRALRTAKLKGYDVEIEFYRGVATLTGKIIDVKQKELATNVVSRVPGVVRVNNNLILVPAESLQRAKTDKSSLLTPAIGDIFSTQKVFEELVIQLLCMNSQSPSLAEPMDNSPTKPARITQRPPIEVAVANALYDAGFSSREILVNYEQDAVILRGRIADQEEKQRATRLAMEVDGVVRVDNQLQVITPRETTNQSTLRRPVVAQIPDIQSRLRGEPAQLSDKGWFTPNQFVASEVAKALSNARLNGYDIEIQFSGSVVTLSGNIENPADITKLTEIARRVPGVLTVINYVEARKEPTSIAE